MSRILVLLPVALWFVWSDADQSRHPAEPAAVVLFLSGLVLAVLVMALLSARAARREARGRFSAQRVSRLAHGLVLPLILGWFALGLFVLDWGQTVRSLTEHTTLPLLALPGALLATFPAYLAWALLVAAEYPMVRQRRESRLLIDLDDGRPIYPPSSGWRYWYMAVRQRLLFALVPLALLMLLRDAGVVVLWSLDVPRGVHMDIALFIASAMVVIAFSPELIRRILPTSPLPVGPLRQQLEALCDRTGMKMRDILVWDTDGAMVNAAVIGFLPRVRYVLLSDVLLDSMTPAQVEAVFAHEIGHVRHGHVLWYFMFLVGITLFLGGPVDVAWRALLAQPGMQVLSHEAFQYVIGFGSLGAVLLLFGLLSRCFERQADVFAARTMQAAIATPQVSGQVRRGAVGAEGAAIFGSSLEQAARLNHIPLGLAARRRGRQKSVLVRVREELSNFLHGTIQSRIDYIRDLGSTPERTRLFDRAVVGVKLVLLFIMVSSAAFMLVR